MSYRQMSAPIGATAPKDQVADTSPPPSLTDVVENLDSVGRVLDDIMGLATGIEVRLVGPVPAQDGVDPAPLQDTGQISALLGYSRELHNAALGIRSTLGSIARAVG